MIDISVSLYSLWYCTEIMDFGYPQNLSPEILKLYITQEGVRSPFSSKVRKMWMWNLIYWPKKSPKAVCWLFVLLWNHLNTISLKFLHWQASDKPVPNATLQVTGAVGWRREGLMYKKNEVLGLYLTFSIFCTNFSFLEKMASCYLDLSWSLPPLVHQRWSNITSFFQVFLDIVESVNLLMSSKGTLRTHPLNCSIVFPVALIDGYICAIPAGSVLRCDVTGKILMKCFLSGMPDLKLGLNDKIGLEKEAQLKSRPTKRSVSWLL